jgi:hypothetical protein
MFCSRMRRSSDGPERQDDLPIQLDSHTPPGDVVGRQLHTWTLAFGFEDAFAAIDYSLDRALLPPKR